MAKPSGCLLTAVLVTFGRAVVDQLRMNALRPMAVFSALGLPAVFVLVISSSAQRGAGGATTEIAVGSAGIGMLHSIITMVVLGLLGEKQWKTLYAALGSPLGLVPVVLGRLAGIAVQSLVALPAMVLLSALMFDVNRGFAWTRWLVGGMLLAFATVSVVGLLGFVVLRLPYSPGMTNGILGLLVALSALVVPLSALPGPVRLVAVVLPQAHAMAWVRSGATSEALAAFGLAIGYCGLIVIALHRLEWITRRRGLPLEM